MVILNFLAAPRAARTGRARDLGEQENWGEAFQKTDTYANLALVIIANLKVWDNVFVGVFILRARKTSLKNQK